MNSIVPGDMHAPRPFTSRFQQGMPNILCTSAAVNLSTLESESTIDHFVVLTLLIIQELNFMLSFWIGVKDSMPWKPICCTRH
jgi:hypothetical protein